MMHFQAADFPTFFRVETIALNWNSIKLDIHFMMATNHVIHFNGHYL